MAGMVGENYPDRKRTRTPVTARKSESDRDMSIRKYFKSNQSLLCSKDSTGDVLEPVQGAGRSGAGVKSSQGVGKAFQPGVNPDALTRQTTKLPMGENI